jgi:hypothetical protein
VLPDYPQAKKILGRQLVAQMKRRIEQSNGLLRGISVFRLWEGDHLTFINEDGQRLRKEMQELSADVRLGVEELDNPGAVLGKFDEAAASIAEQQSALLFKELETATADPDRTVNAGGRALTPELFLDGMAKVDFTFNEDGTPSLPTVVCGPSVMSKLTSVIERVQTESPYKERLAAIVDEKRELWRARESNRKLVG